MIIEYNEPDEYYVAVLSDYTYQLDLSDPKRVIVVARHPIEPDDDLGWAEANSLLKLSYSELKPLASGHCAPIFGITQMCGQVTGVGVG